LVSPTAPRTDTAPAFAGGSAAAAPTATPVAGATPTAPAPATALPFILPDPPGPNDSQALAVNTEDGSIKYDIAYSLVVVKDGAAVDETNSAYALASCKACTTFAVSFQLVLIVGRSDTIMPINVAEALNVNCPSCVTTAIADQIVVTLKAQPSDELLAALTAELKKLDGISDLGGSPADVAQAVFRVQHEIERQLADSGLQANPKATPTPSATASPSPTPSPSATPSASPARTPGATTTPSPSATPTPSATATATPSPTPTDSPSATPTPTP
ncbi:MAG TPA: hypothetical protein VFG79_19130, partial [Solirubrobacter sp.]|nr:hypothetical protein [Solirubrobacter sp.]